MWGALALRKGAAGEEKISVLIRRRESPPAHARPVGPAPRMRPSAFRSVFAAGVVMV